MASNGWLTVKNAYSIELSSLVAKLMLMTSHRERCRERIYVIPGNRVLCTPIIIYGQKMATTVVRMVRGIEILRARKLDYGTNEISNRVVNTT